MSRYSTILQKLLITCRVWYVSLAFDVLIVQRNYCAHVMSNFNHWFNHLLFTTSLENSHRIVGVRPPAPATLLSTLVSHGGAGHKFCAAKLSVIPQKTT